MRRFFINILLFLCILSVCVIVFHVSLLSSRREILTLPTNVNKVFLGNSTMETSVNDSLIKNSFSMGQSAETMNYIYAKLKLIKKYNPQVDTVIMGFDNIILLKHDLTIPHNPNLILFDQFSLSDWIEQLRILPLEKNTDAISHLYTFHKVRPILENKVRKLPFERFALGGYVSSNRQKLDTDIKLRDEARKERTNVNAPQLKDYESINKYYLDKIVEFCNDEDIKLIFLTTPKHHYEWGDTLYREIHKNYYPEITLLDCLEMEFPDSCYGDCVHLNKYGARIFSPEVASMLNQGAGVN